MGVFSKSLRMNMRKVDVRRILASLSGWDRWEMKFEIRNPKSELHARRRFHFGIPRFLLRPLLCHRLTCALHFPCAPRKPWISQREYRKICHQPKALKKLPRLRTFAFKSELKIASNIMPHRSSGNGRWIYEPMVSQTWRFFCYMTG